MPSTTAAAEYPPEGNYEKRRKLDGEDDAEPSQAGPPQGGGPADGRYYDPYAMPMMGRYPYDEGHYREPPTMPYARGHPAAPSPKHHHGHHPGYAYPPPAKDYYQHSYHPDYPPPPPGWGGHHPPHSHAYHHQGKGPGQPFSPRYGQPYEVDRHYGMDPNSNRPKASPANANADGTYQSPTSVVNALDTRSPEGSRNLNNFEERVGGSTTAGVPPNTMMYPPHQPYYPPHMHSPASAHPSRQWWSCDFCSYKFSTWEECSAHESMCPHRASSTSHSKKRSIEALGECRFMDPNEEYANNTDRPTFSLALPTDGQSLSDRQCYVRTHFVELFVATEADVSARHSRGAQKLHLNQVGLRCAYCAKLKPRDRAERAVCYPSSINRIYQTVADMQRFHFEACSAIPPKVLRIYKSLKTTRPRGVGSPQSYWDKSARELGLVDSDCGIVLKDGGALIQKKMEESPVGGPAPIPTLVAPDHTVVRPTEQGAGPWVENAAGVATPQEAATEDEEKGAAPCEADASILLMLKNPDASSPKSTDEETRDETSPIEV